MARKYRFPYLAEHTDGGFKYQRAVPLGLRALIGKAVITEYIGHTSESEAGAKCLALGTLHTKFFHKLRGLSADDKNIILKDGGIGPALGRIHLVEAVGSLTAKLQPATPQEIARFQPGRSLGEIALEQLNGQAVFSRLLTDVKNTREVLTNVAPGPSEYSWEGLFENWKRKTRPKRTEQHPHTLRLLKQILGDMDYRRVTPHHIDQFLSGMDKRGISKPMQVKVRERVSGMFKAAVPLKIKINPCNGVTVDGKPEKIKVRPFSGEQERAIFATAVKTRYGGKRHSEAMWLLQLEAFMGCRVREGSQLQSGDIGVQSSVPVIHFREQCAVTGRKHAEKSIKTGEERTLPLHPALWDKSHPRYVGADFRKFAEGAAGRFIFAAFDYSGDARGRADWIIQNGGKLLKAAGVTGPKGAYAPNHSFRHRWNDAAKNAEWPQDFREAFMGQAKGINAKYGGNVLVKMARMLRDVDPLSDL